MLFCSIRIWVYTSLVPYYRQPTKKITTKLKLIQNSTQNSISQYLWIQKKNKSRKTERKKNCIYRDIIKNLTHTHTKYPPSQKKPILSIIQVIFNVSKQKKMPEKHTKNQISKAKYEKQQQQQDTGVEDKWLWKKKFISSPILWSTILSNTTAHHTQNNNNKKLGSLSS